MIVYNRKVTIPYNCSLSQFVSTMRGFENFSPYPIDGQLWVFDRFDDNITDSGNYENGTKFVWRIFVYKMRSQMHKDQEFNIEYNVIGFE